MRGYENDSSNLYEDMASYRKIRASNPDGCQTRADDIERNGA